MKLINVHLVLAGLLSLLGAAPSLEAAGSVAKIELFSEHFSHNKIGVSSNRRVQVYLPESYQESDRRYPVIYCLHNFFEDENTFFWHYEGKVTFDRAIERGAIGDVIVVTADFNTPAGGSFYANSLVTGNWRDFMVEDLVPHIDSRYRTLPGSKSRGIFGHHAGAYGAIRFASRHPDVFGIVYAMHPVATGFGNIVMQSRPDWKELENVETLADIKGNIFNEIFTVIYQANLPDPNNPPLYFEQPARSEDGELIMDTALIEKLQENFFLERQISEYAENLKSLVALKLDWGRHDPNQDHVYSNQFYSRKLNEFGVIHEAEEYNGGWGDKMFDSGGRINTDVIPFFQKHLQFEEATE